MRFLIACGKDYYIRTDDRMVLEKLILPFFAEGLEWRKILFVGCAWYTRGYQRLFVGKNYWTIECDPHQARYGASQHIVDTLENIRGHFRGGEFDVIICNGVFGWGLNDRDSVEKAFEGCHQCLRDGGVFVLGWNDLPEHTPFPLDDCQALRSFVSFAFPPLGVSRHVVGAGRHTYDFFFKKTELHREPGPKALMPPG